MLKNYILVALRNLWRHRGYTLINIFGLTIGLASFSRQYDVNENLKMAGAVVTLLPLGVIYAFAQKYFVQGITMSGIKG